MTDTLTSPEERGYTTVTRFKPTEEDQRLVSSIATFLQSVATNDIKIYVQISKEPRSYYITPIQNEILIYTDDSQLVGVLLFEAGFHASRIFETELNERVLLVQNDQEIHIGLPQDFQF